METSYGNDNAELGRIADVFGDPTRRGIYAHLRRAAGPLSASEVAEAFGLHRTVARAHLERLAELDLAVVGTRRKAGGGRPAKTYAISRDRLEVILPPRRYERLAQLLLRLVDERLPRDDAMSGALAMGRLYGEEIAQRLNGGDVTRPLSPQAAVGWLDAAGYEVRLDESDPAVVAVDVHNCVYRELALDHPHIVCAFDRGTLCGMLGAQSLQHRQPKAIAMGDEYCRHEFRL